MSSTRIEQLIDTAQAAFDCRPTNIEAGLDRESSAYPRLPVSDECSDALSELRSEQAGVERTAE